MMSSDMRADLKEDAMKQRRDREWTINQAHTMPIAEVLESYTALQEECERQRAELNATRKKAHDLRDALLHRVEAIGAPVVVLVDNGETAMYLRETGANTDDSNMRLSIVSTPMSRARRV